MPYIAILPVVVEPIIEGDVPYTVLPPDMPTDLKELQRSWIQLKKERDTFRDHFYVNEKKVLELTKQFHKKKVLTSISARRGSAHGKPDCLDFKSF